MKSRDNSRGRNGNGLSGTPKQATVTPQRSNPDSVQGRNPESRAQKRYKNNGNGSFTNGGAGNMNGKRVSFNRDNSAVEG